MLGLVCCYRGQVMRCANELEQAQEALNEAHKISAMISKGAQFELLQCMARLEKEIKAS